MKDVTGTAKILFLDIETAPSLGWVWGKWQVDILDFKSDWYMLSVAYKWSHEKEVKVLGLDDFRGYKSNPEDDSRLVGELWKLLDKADIVIAHNGDRFDLPKINTRFLTHKLPPPTPYRTVDTLKIAKRMFRFDSNRLDDLARYLGVGRKLPHTGFHLWKGCMEGDREAWKLMKDYNKQDVALLEKVYYLIRSWDKNHPTVNKGQEACPVCGGTDTVKRGFSYTRARRKQQYQCHDCYHWFSGPATK